MNYALLIRAEVATWGSLTCGTVWATSGHHLIGAGFMLFAIICSFISRSAQRRKP